MKPRALDLFCCAGGASMGLPRVGFDVTGIDIRPQPRYPFRFIQADALTWPIRDTFLLKSRPIYDFVWASPPCQAHTLAQRIRGNKHPDLIAPIRARLEASEIPFCIENVEGAPLRDAITLCGAMFGLRTYRHRLFECSFPVAAPEHPQHDAPLRKMGRPVEDGEFMHVVGNFSGVKLAREIMGMPWASRDDLREAIPPAYAEYIGRAALNYIRKAA